MVTGLQLKLARTAVGLDIRTAASKAGVAVGTILRAEGDENVMRSSIEKLRSVYELMGVGFSATGGIEPPPLHCNNQNQT